MRTARQPGKSAASSGGCSGSRRLSGGGVSAAWAGSAMAGILSVRLPLWRADQPGRRINGSNAANFCGSSAAACFASMPASSTVAGPDKRVEGPVDDSPSFPPHHAGSDDALRRTVPATPSHRCTGVRCATPAPTMLEPKKGPRHPSPGAPPGSGSIILRERPHAFGVRARQVIARTGSDTRPELGTGGEPAASPRLLTGTARSV